MELETQSHLLFKKIEKANAHICLKYINYILAVSLSKTRIKRENTRG